MKVYEALLRDGKSKRERIEEAKSEAQTLHMELVSLLPGAYYMDPPDGGSVTLLEQLQRMAKDAERYRWLRNRLPADVLGQVKSAAGCWIDCEDDEGVLILLTGDDADAAVDAAIGAAPAVGAA